MGRFGTHMRQVARNHHQTPRGRHCLPKWTRPLARISMVHGSMSIRRTQHLVPHSTKSRIQKTRQNQQTHHSHDLAGILHQLDHHSMFSLPSHTGRIPTNGTPRNQNHTNCMALAHALHPRALLLVSAQSQMVLRTISANRV